MIQRMFATVDIKKTNYKNVGKINHGDDLILEIRVLSDGNTLHFNNPMVDLLVKKSDGKMVRQTSGIELTKPNIFLIEVSKDCVTSPGLTTNQLIINDDGRVSTCMFYYTVLNSLEEDVMPSISNVEVLEQLDEFVVQIQDKMELFDSDLAERMDELTDSIVELEKNFNDTSSTLNEAEVKRSEAEQLRVQAEVLRVQNEDKRAESENVRVQNESDRAAAELIREQREVERVLNDEERHQNESERAMNEELRQRNESVRQSNESIRMSNETDRKTQENRRATAETNRVNAETTRRNNENSRISNETERQKAMNEMKSLIGNVNDFNERVGVIEDEIEGINSSLDNKASITIDETMLKSYFGAKGDGVSDDTQAIQNALNYIRDTQGYGSLLLCKGGLYKISDTLYVPSSISIRGADGGIEEAKPTITWYGASGKNMIEVGDSSLTNNLHENPFKNFNLRGKGRNAINYAKNGIVFKQRCDLGSYIQDVSMHLFEECGVVYEKGGVNVHCRNFRIDSVGKFAIKWCLGGVDYFSIDGFTCDGNRADLNKCGGVFELDIEKSTSNHKLNFNISNAKIEVNSNPINEMFKFNTDKNRQISANVSFNNVFINALYEYTGICFTPLSYDSRLIIINSLINNIEGLNGYNNKNDNGFHSLSVLTPNSISNSLSNSYDRNIIDLYGDVDINNLYSKGNKVSSIIQADFNPIKPVTYKIGDWLIDKTTCNSLCRYVKEVVSNGTIGNTNAKGSISNSTQLMVDIIEDFSIGDYITISGNSRRIVGLDSDKKILVLSSAINSSLANEAISFTPPVYNEHQLLTKRYWYPTQPSHGTFKKGDIVFNTDIKVGKYAGWICSEDGSPGTWLGFGKLETPT